MQGKKISANQRGPISEAVESRDWPQARYLLAQKLAGTLDACDSARDIKTVARELIGVLDRVELDDRAKVAASEDSPLAALLREAEEQDAEIAALRAV